MIVDAACAIQTLPSLDKVLAVRFVRSLREQVQIFQHILWVVVLAPHPVSTLARLEVKLSTTTHAKAEPINLLVCKLFYLHYKGGARAGWETILEALNQRLDAAGWHLATYFDAVLSAKAQVQFAKVLWSTSLVGHAKSAFVVGDQKSGHGSLLAASGADLEIAVHMRKTFREAWLIETCGTFA